MVGQAVLATAHQDLVVVEVYLVEEILKSMPQSQLILESPPHSKPLLLSSTDELLKILPVPPLLNPTLLLSLKAPKHMFHRVCQ